MSEQKNENETGDPDTPDTRLPDSTKAGYITSPSERKPGTPDTRLPDPTKAGPTKPEPTEPEPTEINDIISRYFQGLNSGDLSVVDEVVAPDYTGDFISGPQVALGRESLKHHITTFRSAFPDIDTTVEDVIVAGDKVVARYTGSGTHQGEFMGIRPTNKRVQFKGIDIFRIADGKIAEHWTSRNDLGLMQQLGVVQTLGERGR